MTSEEKFGLLRKAVLDCGKAAIAFSGGVDSSFLCRVARDVLGDGVVAITVVSPMLPASEIDDAKAIAGSIGIRHILIDDPRIDEAVAANPADRCYHCKKIEFGAVIDAARKVGIERVLDGSNVDDLGDYRPGAAAIAELGVGSPLRDAGLGKEEIRELSRRLGLATWDKPAFACLASRIPYGQRITREILGRIEAAEEYLRGLGVRQLRVRCHGDIARIEIAPEERAKLFDGELMDSISLRLKSLGFLYVCMELQGYRTGSLNRALSVKGDGHD